MNPHCRECDAVEKQNGRRRRRKIRCGWSKINKKFEQKLHFLRFVDYVSIRFSAHNPGGWKTWKFLEGLSLIFLTLRIMFQTELMLEQLAVAREIHRRRRTFRTLSFRRTIKYKHRRRIPTGRRVHHSCHVRSFLPGKKSAIFARAAFTYFQAEEGAVRNLDPSKNKFFNQWPHQHVRYFRLDAQL